MTWWHSPSRGRMVMVWPPGDVTIVTLRCICWLLGLGHASYSGALISYILYLTLHCTSVCWWWQHWPLYITISHHSAYLILLHLYLWCSSLTRQKAPWSAGEKPRSWDWCQHSNTTFFISPSLSQADKSHIPPRSSSRLTTLVTGLVLYYQTYYWHDII